MKIAIAGASGTVGHHVVDAAQGRGHDVMRLSRSDGIDLTSGDGLSAALTGTDVIIDVTNAGTIEEHAATESSPPWRATSKRLQKSRSTSPDRPTSTRGSAPPTRH
jgi:putative NADH-flavin reductase